MRTPIPNLIPILALTALTLALGGCSQCNPPPKAADSGEKAAPAAKTAEAPAVKPAPTVDSDAPAFPKQPGLPEALTGFDFTLNRAAATAKFPEAVTDAGATLPGGVIAKIHFFSRSDQVRFATLKLPEAIQTWLKANWGAGATVPSPGGTDTYWVTDTRQFQLAGETLGIWPVQHWEALLGDGPTLGIEDPARPLLGATAAEIEEVYASARPRVMSATRMELRLAPLPLQASPTRVAMTLKDDKVVRVRIKLYHADRKPLRTAMLARLATKFGTPTPNAAGQRVYEIEANGVPAEVRVLDLEVGGFLTVDIRPR